MKGAEREVKAEPSRFIAEVGSPISLDNEFSLGHFEFEVTKGYPGGPCPAKSWLSGAPGNYLGLKWRFGSCEHGSCKN